MYMARRNSVEVYYGLQTASQIDRQTYRAVDVVPVISLCSDNNVKYAYGTQILVAHSKSCFFTKYNFFAIRPTTRGHASMSFVLFPDAVTPSSTSSPSPPTTITTATRPMPLSKALDRRAFFQGATATVSLVLAGATVALADNPKSGRNPALEWKEPEITQKAYIDISIADKPEGRLVIAVSTDEKSHVLSRLLFTCSIFFLSIRIKKKNY